MRRIIAILPLFAVFSLVGCGNEKPQKSTIDIPEIKENGTVVILATGGTIAGSGEEGQETGYDPGSIKIEDIIASVPGIDEIAPLEAVQVCNINSDDITSTKWLEIADTINECSKDEKVAGFVITHGTDTMEETAYFLNLAIKTDKPVVITGSMRPATAISADGPMNLYQSVVVAASEEAKGKGVLGVFSDSIYSARSMQKVSTFDVTAISAGPMGAVGFVRNQEVFFYETSIKRHTTNSEFNDVIDKIDPTNYQLPKVSTIYFQADSDPDIIDWALNRSEGIVIAGAGAGEFSEGFINKLNALNTSKPIIISSRIDNGIITQDSVLVEKSVAANDLPPHKAAVLLRLAIAKYTNLNQEELIRIYKEY